MNYLNSFRKAIAYSLFALTSLLSGCSLLLDDPVYDSVTRDFDTLDVDNDEISYRIGYLGEALLEPNTRIDIYNALAKVISDQQRTESALYKAANISTTSRMVSDLSVGKLNSSVGAQLGNTLAISSLALSLFSSDGSLDITTGVFLPNSFNGAVIKSIEEADLAAQQLIANQLEKSSINMGYTFECVTGCGSAVSLYYFKRLPNTNISHYIYAPESFAAITNIASLQPVAKDTLVDSIATGIDVAWRSKFGNQAQIILVANPLLDESGSIDFKLADPNKSSSLTIRGDTRLSRTDFGDKFNRLVHSTPYTVYGNSEAYPNVLYFNGKVYRFILNSVATTFDEYIL